MKIAVVGASVAGAGSAVNILTRKPDVELFLIDRSFERVEKCAGGFSNRMYVKTGLPLPPTDVVQSKITSVRIYGPDFETWCGFKSRKPIGYVVDRARFERWLIGWAERLGARLVELKVSTVKQVRILFNPGVIVGADGLHSAVRRSVGIPLPKPGDVHVCVQYRCGWDDHPHGEVRFYFGSNTAPSGYAWVFPAEPGTVKIGLGIPASAGSNPAKLLNRFARRIGAPKPRNVVAKSIPTSLPLRHVVYGDIALVGDSAFHCCPATGAGICNALIAARLLGESVARGDLTWYDRMQWKHVGKRNRRRYFFKQLLYSMSDRAYSLLAKLLRKPVLMLSWIL